MANVNVFLLGGPYNGHVVVRSLSELNEPYEVAGATYAERGNLPDDIEDRLGPVLPGAFAVFGYTGPDETAIAALKSEYPPKPEAHS